MNQNAPDQRRSGRLTPEEHRELERLAQGMVRPNPGIIAIRMKRSRATIAWQMMVKGLWAPKKSTKVRRPIRRRDGVVLTSYSPAEDARLLELRGRGVSRRVTGQILSKEFQTNRSEHSVHVREVQLAAYAEAAA